MEITSFIQQQQQQNVHVLNVSVTVIAYTLYHLVLNIKNITL